MTTIMTELVFRDIDSQSVTKLRSLWQTSEVRSLYTSSLSKRHKQTILSALDLCSHSASYLMLQTEEPWVTANLLFIRPTVLSTGVRTEETLREVSGSATASWCPSLCTGTTSSTPASSGSPSSMGNPRGARTWSPGRWSHFVRKPVFCKAPLRSPRYTRRQTGNWVWPTCRKTGQPSESVLLSDEENPPGEPGVKPPSSVVVSHRVWGEAHTVECSWC